jgi:hypothetical protein
VLRNFIERAEILNKPWGVSGGSGVDHVWAMLGGVLVCLFEGGEGRGGTGVELRRVELRLLLGGLLSWWEEEMGVTFRFLLRFCRVVDERGGGGGGESMCRGWLEREMVFSKIR